MTESQTIKAIRTSDVGRYPDRLTEEMAMHLIKTRIFSEMTELALAGVTSRAFSMSNCIKHYVEFDADRMDKDFKDVAYAIALTLYEDFDFYTSQKSNDIVIVSTERIPKDERVDFEDVKTDYYDQDSNSYTVDAWEVGKGEGRVIAVVNAATADAYWIDKQAAAYSDKAKVAVAALVKRIKEGKA